MPHTTAARLREAAFELFAEQGYDATSVDQVAERAGVGRSTFFRTYPSKEAVIFPDHEAVLSRIEARLAAATTGQHFLAVREAAHIVLRHYLDDDEHARARYRLTRSVPALREREIAGMQRYQEAFRRFARSWYDDADAAAALRADLRAELLAASVVTAHNHVLRRWLRRITSQGETEAEFERAMDEVERMFSTREPDDAGRGGHVVVLGPGADLDEAIDAVRRALS
ncbi:TetR family transcriptional regulator [Nocardioides seonyuensis]|uniref:TetR family transcriptional regulator n=1 Tax=Nocardioides seonyuensis TaxID=2518371 RepID=A0A4P7IJ50_9ACTN|nr:TetR/AcrR family transcriptional regulator [Nocardioides seonyuensis]QBX56297.1 TetR family transcriptional regulator [Nocardioides seonyuensis]